MKAVKLLVLLAAFFIMSQTAWAGNMLLAEYYDYDRGEHHRYMREWDCEKCRYHERGCWESFRMYPSEHKRHICKEIKEKCEYKCSRHRRYD